MGIDGLSMANLGLHKDSTSAQLANQAEALALKGTEFKIKDVSELAPKVGIKTSKDSQKHKHKNKDSYDENQDNPKKTRSDIDFEHEDPKNYTVKVNAKTELIELIDNKTQKVIETITAEDLMYMISKLNSVSGVLVNRKI